MINDLSQIKHRLREFIEKRGIAISNKNLLKCPRHEDNNPSAVFYKQGKNSEFPVVWCPVCQESLGIFEFAGLLDNVTDFKDKLESVNKTLGIEMQEKIPEKKKEKKPISLPLEKAKEIYRRDIIEGIAKEKEWGNTIAGTWKYHDKKGDVIALDVRFEGGVKKKEVITFWYDGTLKWYGAPVFIYNLHEVMKSEKPILMCEGAKCSDCANGLDTFVSTSWSGGSAKAHLCDWKIFSDREVYILPDDDEPGQKAAIEIKKQLPHAKIVSIVEKARTIKEKGADIVEILQVMTPAELTQHILNTPEIKPEQPELKPIIESDEPFKILGIGSDKNAHFTTQWGEYERFKLDTISKGKLNVLAQLSYWKENFPGAKGGVLWDEAQDYIVCQSSLKQFDETVYRGRGAWRDGDKISYHDGIKTYGEHDLSKIYLKLPRVDLGIESQPASAELLTEIKDILFQLSFETKSDVVRTLGWSVLAPFCGALEYRPTLLLTGASGHGKTKVQTLFIKKLTDFIHADMRTTSEAGMRRKIGKDSRVVFFDEAGKENEKMKMNFDTLLGFIRSNYSDDSPDGYKANMNADGYMTFKMSSMFGLATTDPEIENVQDENRILRVHFVKPTHTADQWEAIENKLKILMSKENCDSIRALTWSRLKIIIALAKKIVQIARNKTSRDYRSSYSDMLLAASYMVIWCDTPEPTQEQIENMLDKYYSAQPIEENRDEVAEIVDRLLDEVIEIIHGQRREKLSILETMTRVHFGYSKHDDEKDWVTPEEKKIYQRTLAQYGCKVMDNGNIAIAVNHHMISRIIGHSSGYSKLLRRHKGFVSGGLKSFSGDKNRQAIVIGGLIVNNDIGDTTEETLERLFE